MIIRIRNGIIYKVEYDVEFVIGTIVDGTSEEAEKTLECGAEIIPVVENFMKEVNSGKFKPRKIVKELEKILDKYAIKSAQ